MKSIDVADTFRYSLYSPEPWYPKSLEFCADAPPTAAFSSLYRVTEETANAIKTLGSVKGFRGVVWSPTLWMDFDSYEEGQKAVDKLQMQQFKFCVYDTGGRGLHIGVDRPIAPSHLLPEVDKQWVKEHFPQADSSIYSHLHLFRCSGARHHKTGRFKTLVNAYDGIALSLDPMPKKTVFEKVWENSGEAESRYISVFDNPQVLANSVPTKAGERHGTFVRALLALRDHNTPPSVARWWVGEINKMSEQPKSTEELDKLVESLFC